MKKSYITGRNHDFYDKGKAMFDRIQVLPEHQTMAATPYTELIAELMNPNIPKNEREHAAVREIERLQEALAQPEMRKATREEKISNPGVYEVPVQPAPRIVTAEEHRVLTNALLKAGKVISPPQRHLESTTDMMMELADRLGELPDDIDPRAWLHLLVYAPQRPWVGLTEWEREAIALECGAMSADWLVFMEAVEKALKEKNQ